MSISHEHSDADIMRVLTARAAQPEYPLEMADVEKHQAGLIRIIREKIKTLAGEENSRISIIEALNHVLMSPRWMRRDTGGLDEPPPRP